MARNKGRGCPDRWRLKHSSQFSKPPRPPACPCRWSPNLIAGHFTAVVGSDADLDALLSRLLLLWP